MQNLQQKNKILTASAFEKIKNSGVFGVKKVMFSKSCANQQIFVSVLHKTPKTAWLLDLRGFESDIF